MRNEHRNANLKRHCMVVHAYYPLGETRVEREARALIDAGYEVDVLCLRAVNEVAFEIDSGVNIYRLPLRRRKGRGTAAQLVEYLTFFWLAFFKLISLQRRRQYRTVQVHNLPDFLVFAALGSKLAGAKLILDLHDLMPEFFAARFGTGLSSLPVRLVRWQEWLSCRFADCVITVTELWRQTLIKRGVPQNKVFVIMNVADDRIFRLDQVTAPAPKSDGRFRLIYHGNLTERYGIDLAIRAVDIVRKEVPKVHLTIHGGGDYRRVLQALAEELHLDDHVTFSTRFMPTDQLPQFIRQADVGIVPYRRDIFTDGILPTKLMEYAALGLPSIASRTTAIETYFGDNMAELFTPGDVNDLVAAIRRLYHDRARLAQLANGCLTFNERYHWRKISADYVALVEQLGAST